MTIFVSNDHMIMMLLLLLGSKTWRGMPRRSRPGWDGQKRSGFSSRFSDRQIGIDWPIARLVYIYIYIYIYIYVCAYIYIYYVIYIYIRLSAEILAQFRASPDSRYEVDIA